MTSNNMIWRGREIATIYSRIFYDMRSRLAILTVTNEPVHEISNNVVCATSKGSDQPAKTRSLIRAFTRRLNIL